MAHSMDMAETDYENQRVGDWEATQGGYDVAADPVHGIIHFVYGSYGNGVFSLYYSSSTNGGTTWTPASLIQDQAMSPALAVGTDGVLHLAYGIPMPGAGEVSWGREHRISYTSYAGEKWSTPLDVSAGIAGYDNAIAPRIAVDGDNNLHLIMWSFVRSDYDKTGRCAYRRKVNGKTDFEPVQIFGPLSGAGGTETPAITTDAAGDVHIVYQTRVSSSVKAVERRIRHRDGTWNPQHDYFSNVGVSDFSLSSAVGADGVLHLAAHRYGGAAGGGVAYMNNRDDPRKLTVNSNWSDVFPDNYTDLLVLPNGDRWVAALNWAEEKKPAEFALAWYYHYKASVGDWSGPILLSPEDYTNANTKREMNPKWLLYQGKVRLFYAEQAPGQGFKYYQRIFSSGSAGK